MSTVTPSHSPVDISTRIVSPVPTETHSAKTTNATNAGPRILALAIALAAVWPPISEFRESGP